MYFREVTTGIYPWDIHDEGIENILDNLQQVAGCNAAYMLSLMHYEKRPPYENYYPHNPVRKYYLPEDSRCYFQVHPEMYGDSRIKPLTSERDFLKGTDWLDVFTKAVRKRGMKVGSQITHTPLDSERGRNEFSDCLQRDVYGNFPSKGRKTSHHLCWNSPDAVAYVSAICSDIVSHYDVDMLQFSTFLFHPGDSGPHPFLGLMLGGCFCANCEREARKAGLDWDLIKKTVKYFADLCTGATLAASEDMKLIKRGNTSGIMFLLEHPELYEWLRFRCDSVTRYIKELSGAVHSANPKIDFRINTIWDTPEYDGFDLTKIAKYLDSIRICDYAEQGGDEAEVDRKGIWISNVRRQVGDEMPIIGAISPRGKATPSLIKKAIKNIALSGADGLAFGFYDCASMERLSAIKQGLEEAEIKVRD